MNLSSQKSAIALSASAAALLMPVSAFAEDGAAGAAEKSRLRGHRPPFSEIGLQASSAPRARV